ncbi:MAG: putative signal transduction protein with domain [Clostridia bacterium]|nr:putative signal transduction protein with domain [Clostridia bacterium]
MNLTERQMKIIEIVQKHQPITGNDIADRLGCTKPTIRADLSLLTRSGILDAKPNVGYILNHKPADNPHDFSLFRAKVKDVKSPAVYVEEECSIHDAIVKIFLKDAGTIFVVDADGYLSGVVSRKDFLKSIMGNMNIHNVPVGVIMTRMPNIIHTHDEETVLQAAMKIMEHKIDSMPVVEEVGNNLYKITGRISKTTISKVFVEIGKNSGEWGVGSEE